MRIVNGRRGETSPRWLLLAVTGALGETGGEYTLKDYNAPLYRLGWLTEDPEVARWVPRNTPFILIEIPGGSASFLTALANRLDTAAPSGADRHS